MQVPVAEPCPPADPREPVRHVVRSSGVPKALGKIKSCSCQAGPIAIRSPASRARWRRSNSTSSGVRKRVRLERLRPDTGGPRPARPPTPPPVSSPLLGLRSPITRRVRSLEVLVRSRTRFTACVTFRVADLPVQSRPVQTQRLSAPKPNASITVSNGSSRVPCTCSRSALALVNREGPPFVAPNARCGGEGGRIARNQALSRGLPQGAAKYSSNDADRVGAVAGVALPGEADQHRRQFVQNFG